jgi:hypothetical protein
MACATITVTDITKTPQNLATLLAGGTLPSGYSIVPTKGIAPPALIGSTVAYLSIQADPSNGGTNVYKGDENVANNDSCQGKVLTAGATDVQQMYPMTVNLNEIYLTASANNAKINIEVHWA